MVTKRTVVYLVKIMLHFIPFTVDRGNQTPLICADSSAALQISDILIQDVDRISL